jgi:hypothetical protein
MVFYLQKKPLEKDRAKNKDMLRNSKAGKSAIECGFRILRCTLDAGGGITDSNSGGVGSDRRAVSSIMGKRRMKSWRALTSDNRIRTTLVWF